MNCITCNKRPAVCDDNCVECETDFYLSDKAEAESLIEFFNKYPKHLEAWRPVVDAIMRMH